MPRSRILRSFLRHGVSRVVVTSVVLAITVGSAYQLRKLRAANAAPPPLQMSVSPNPGNAVAVKPTVTSQPPSVVTSPAQRTLITPLVTQTPTSADKTKNVGQPIPIVQVNPVAPKPIPVLAPIAPVTAAAQSLNNFATVLTDADAKVKAADLLGARDMLNSALISGKLSAVDADAVKKQMSDINQTLVFSPQKFPKDPLGGVYTVKSGDQLSAIGKAHSVPFELLMQLNRMTDAKKLRFGQSLKVINGPFHVIVSKSKFSMDVYLGAAGGNNSTYITTFAVGLGTDNSTPTGTWSIKNKVTHPVYYPPEGHEGPVLDPNDPKNPLGNYWMGLEGTDGQAVGQRSYGIHGTIDPTSIGKQSSMGCIRLKNEDVEVVYKLLVVDKSIVVVGE